MDNKFPGKDISDSDLKDKFPLAKQKNHPIIIPDLRSVALNLEEKKSQSWQDLIWSKIFR